MVRRVLAIVATFVLHATLVAAQQSTPQPLTFWYDYTVKPGKEAEFLELVKTVGAPVRDKLMAEGVVMGWAVERPLLRGPDQATHTIWYSVNDYAGIAKVEAAMAEALQKPYAGSAPKGARPMSNLEKSLEVFEVSKTRDWVTRDVEFGIAPSVPAGALPITRYGFVKALPGKGRELRATWNKYQKPVFEKLLKEGVVLGYGLGVEDIKTSGNFTHFQWYMVADMAGVDKVTAAFDADRARRTQEERDAITAAFAAAMDGSASRGMITRSLVFKLATPR